MPELAVFRAKAGWFFHSSPPTHRDEWRATAERRWIAALQIEHRLPLDSPPELVLLTETMKDGTLRAYEDFRKAQY